MNRAVKALKILVKQGPVALFNKIKHKIIQRNLYRYYLYSIKKLEDNNNIKKEKIRAFKYRPKISIIIPVYNTKEKWLRDCVNSVLNQVYDNWELCIVDGYSTKSYIRKVLEKYARQDSRIKVKFLTENKGIAGNSNEAVSIATGEFVGLLDHDDELSSDALYEVVKALNNNPNADFIYSDYAITDKRSSVQHIIFCPDFCRFFYLSHPYIVHLVVIRKIIIDKVGMFDEHNFNDGVSHDVDLFLRMFSILEDKHILHIPKVLYFWKHYESSAGFIHMNKVSMYTKLAIQKYLTSKNMDGWIEDGLVFNTFRVRFKIKNNPLISIIIPTKDKYQLLEKCLKSIEEKGGYGNYEIIIVKNNTQDSKALNYLESLSKRYNVLEYTLPFNYSAINNYAVKFAKGELILFLNDDIEFIANENLLSMLELLQLQEVGVVGGKLLLQDKRIQHAGVIIGLGSSKICEHLHKFTKAYIKNRVEPGYISSLVAIREYLAVTGACLMTKRYIFEEVNGFSEELKIGYNDTDFCLKAISRGYKVLFTPYTLAYHYENSSRKDKNVLYHPEDGNLFMKRWESIIKEGDPCYNPNLSLESFEPIPRL